MRVFIYISLVFLCLKNGVLCYAQDAILDTNKLPKTILYREDYINQSKRFVSYSDATGKAYIKKGQYYCENKTEEPRDNFNLFNIDPKEDYYIEFIFAQIDGPIDYGNGLLFNYSPTKKWNAYDFLITADQYFQIRKFENDVEASIKKWTFCNYIKTKGENKLAVFAKANTMYFYINDRLVHQIKRPACLGTSIGHAMAPKTVLAIDRFTIRYNPLPFNVIPDAVQGYKRIKLNNNINSLTDDNFPILSADGKMMFFTRSENMGVVDLDVRTIMTSEYSDSMRTWLPAIPLSSAINQGGIPQAVYISPNKNILIINAMYENGKYVKDEGLSISYKTDRGWSPPEKMFIDNYENLCLYESYALSADSKVMILSVHTSKGFGEADLYVSFRISGTTNWTSPQNLGAIVNSFGSESSPYLAADNVTLYYSSGGKPGYGQSDFFVTRRLDDTWLNWSRPLNLGSEINTEFEEIGITLDENAEYALVDDFDSITYSDLYRIKLPESARPKPFVLIRGNIYEKHTNKPVEATVIYERMETLQHQQNSIFSDKKGTYELVLVDGSSYELAAAAKGYLTESKIIYLSDTSKGSKLIHADIYLVPLAEGSTVVLNTIAFVTDKCILLEISFPELDRLYNVLFENPNVIIEVQGHTDIGDALNEVSLCRANAVRDYLVSKGISVERIKTVGYGSVKPISKNNTVLNKRIEVKIIKK